MCKYIIKLLSKLIDIPIISNYVKEYPPICFDTSISLLINVNPNQIISMKTKLNYSILFQNIQGITATQC